MGALLGGEVVHAEVGDLVFKPRDQWHTFWNAGDEPCRILEIISPGGFEGLFRELGAKLAGDMDPAEVPAFFAHLSETTGSSSTPRRLPPSPRSTASGTRSSGPRPERAPNRHAGPGASPQGRPRSRLRCRTEA